MRRFARKPSPTQDSRPARERAAPPSHGMSPPVRETGLSDPAPNQITRDFSQIPRSSAVGPVVQAKLAISQPGDRHEQEADRVAEQVMRMADSPGSPGYVASPPGTLQRKCTDCEDKDKKKDEEVPEIQRLATGDFGGVVPSEFTSGLGSGSPLDPASRGFFEPRFGHDFSNVRVHDGPEAATAAAGIRARAFTFGQDVVFGAGEHNPASDSGKRLLAHELTHVVQQSRGPSSNRGPQAIQRKIVIGGKDYTPTADYYTYLKSNFGDAMVEFIKDMHNGGKPPDFQFDTNEQMGREVRVRAAAIKGMEEVHKGCCNYPSAGKPDNLDPTYWDRQGPYQYTLKPKLPAGKGPSDAIEAIFKAGAETRLECNSTMVAIQYRAMLAMLGAPAFNKKFPAGAGLIISPHHVPPAGVAQHPIWSKDLYKELTISGPKDLMPGDWVYFKNIDDYIDRHPGGAWSGEHALYLGNGMFRGFGVKEQSQADLEAELLRIYNDGLDPKDKKSSVPGLQNYVRRPVIGNIEKT